MPRIAAIDLFELNLPFRRPFHHAAAERTLSGSLFARFVTDSGHIGFGETLPRSYVTREGQADTFDVLAGQLLPRLLEMEFASWGEVHDFLLQCDGVAPPDWIDSAEPRTAAWCLVDLGLLDAFGRAFGREIVREVAGNAPWPRGLHYSVVLSGEPGLGSLGTLVKSRLYGLREVKVKVAGDDGDARDVPGVRLAKRVLGPRARIRADANMAWSYAEARKRMPPLAAAGVEIFEQPLAADDLESSARLVRETGFGVMADEGVHDAESLERLIATRACTAVNVRIAKCGGLVAALARSRRALEAGLTLQVGCQVGETSQLSAAQIVLIRAIGSGVSFAEGCFGERLLHTDPVEPVLQFRRRGYPPPTPPGAGFGTRVDMRAIRRHSGRHLTVGSLPARLLQESS